MSKRSTKTQIWIYTGAILMFLVIGALFTVITFLFYRLFPPSWVFWIAVILTVEVLLKITASIIKGITDRQKAKLIREIEVMRRQNEL